MGHDNILIRLSLSRSDKIDGRVSAIDYKHPINPLVTNLSLGMVMGAVVFALVAFASRRSGIIKQNTPSVAL
jgi:hypothetical protein